MAEATRWVRAVSAPADPPTCLPLTSPALTGASNIYVPVTGSNKAQALRHVVGEAPDEHLYPVRRRYVTPAEWDTPGRDVTLDEVERWCVSCCTHYPHVPVDAA